MNTEKPSLTKSKFKEPLNWEAIKEEWRERGYTRKEITDNPGKIWHWETHEAEQIATVKSGKILIEFENETVLLEVGDEAVIPFRAWHRASNPFDKPCEWMYGCGRP